MPDKRYVCSRGSEFKPCPALHSAIIAPAEGKPKCDHAFAGRPGLTATDPSSPEGSILRYGFVAEEHQ